MTTSPFFWVILTMIGSGLLLKIMRRPLLWVVFVSSIGMFIFMLYAKIKLPEISSEATTSQPKIMVPTILIMLGLLAIAVVGGRITWAIGKKLRPEQMNSMIRTGRVIRNATEAKSAARKILRQENIQVGDHGFSANQRNAEWIVQFFTDDKLTVYTVTMTQHGIGIGEVTRAKAYLTDRKVVEKLAMPYLPRNTEPRTHTMKITQAAGSWTVTVAPKNGQEGATTKIKVDAVTHAVTLVTKG